MSDILLGFDEFNLLAIGILKDGRALSFTVHGNSMRPFIQDGDLVEVVNITSTGLRRGDVVLCRLGHGRLVVHRVIRVNSETVLIQGDALPYPDESITRASVLGRVDNLFRQEYCICLDSFK